MKLTQEGRAYTAGMMTAAGVFLGGHGIEHDVIWAVALGVALWFASYRIWQGKLMT